MLCWEKSSTFCVQGIDLAPKCYKIDGKYYVNMDEIAYLIDSELDPRDTGFVIYTTYPYEVEIQG